MPNYSEFVLELQAEIERLEGIRDNADSQIEKLHVAIQAIEQLAAESDQPILDPPPLSADEQRGFTNQVRSLFKSNPAVTFSAVTIRDYILEKNPDADPKITLIHAHNTLRRLVRQNEITETQMASGRIGYTLKPQKLAPVVDLMAALKESLAQMEGKQKLPKRGASLLPKDFEKNTEEVEKNKLHRE